MSERIKVSLYIPCFNADKYISFCLKAVLNQSYPVEEIIVIDDGSTDNTSDIISQFPVKIIKYIKNKGLPYVRNLAIKNAKNDFLACVDADCVPEKDWLQKLIKNFSPEVAGVGGKLVESDTNEIIDSWRSIRMKQHWGDKKSDSVPFLFGSNNVFRKKILDDVGGYKDKWLNNYEDVDISRRVNTAGYKTIYEPEALVYHIKHDDYKSILDTYWNWNFGYHQEKGFYRDYTALCSKIEDNIGLSNKFIVEDYKKNQLHFIYTDFLISIYFTLKDFFLIYNREYPFPENNSNSFYALYTNLIDLNFFSHIDNKSNSFRSLVCSDQKALQNFLVFLVFLSKSLMKEFNDSKFIKGILMYCLKSFVKEKDELLEISVKKLLLMADLNKDCNQLLMKEHPNLERNIIQHFFKKFDEWLNILNLQIPDIFNLIKLSQNKIIKRGVRV